MRHRERSLVKLSGAACAAFPVSASIPTAVAAQMRTWEWHGEWRPMGVWAFGMFVLFMAFWALVIVGAIVGLRWLLRSARGTPDDPAIRILRERYARGEIGREEFEARMRDLRDHH